MSKIVILKRSILSLAGGTLVTIGVFILILFTYSGDSEKSLDERHPFAWVLTWPEHLLSVESLHVVVFGNVLLYSTLIYLLLAWRDK